MNSRSAEAVCRFRSKGVDFLATLADERVVVVML